MTLSLTEEKKEKIISICKKIVDNHHNDIRTVAKAIGTIVSSFEAVPNGPLHYRQLEQEKITALKLNKGNFEANMTLSNKAIAELKWWISNISTQFRDLTPVDIDSIIYTDASKEGWGVKSENWTFGGRWSEVEKDLHINVLEMKAAFMALQCIIKRPTYKHVRLMIDNTTAVSYINSKGGIRSPECNETAKRIWEYANKMNFIVSAAIIITSIYHGTTLSSIPWISL